MLALGTFCLALGLSGELVNISIMRARERDANFRVSPIVLVTWLFNCFGLVSLFFGVGGFGYGWLLLGFVLLLALHLLALHANAF